MTVRDATAGDFAAIARLYAQLHPADPPVTDRAAYQAILDGPGLHLLVLDHDGMVAATTYLNVVPNLTRAGSPYAIVENVVVDEALRGRGLGKRLMAATLRHAWDAGCYKAMLMTGSRRASTHGFYRACGFDPDDKTGYVARPG